jgi:hypothetical protein
MIKNTKKLKNETMKTTTAKAPAPAVIPAPAASPAPAVKPIVAATAVATPASAKPIPAAAPTKALPTPTAQVSAIKNPKTSHISLELVRPDAKTVCVAGSFNEWKPEKAPLVQKGNGRWVGDLSVNPGKYEYLFVVDGQWLPDPNAKEFVQNPFGGKNSVLTVSE